MEAKQTVWQKLKGTVWQEDLPEGYRIVAQAGTLVGLSDEGKPVYRGDGDTLLEIDVAALETQRRSLHMAFKVKGLYASQKREHTGKDGKPVEMDVNVKGEMNLVALQKAIRKDQEER